MYTKQSSDKIQELKSPALSIKTGYLDDDFRIFSLVSEEEGEFQPHYHSFHKLLFFESGSFSRSTLYLCRLAKCTVPSSTVAVHTAA